ncbi:hypothetical protein [Paenibacillus xylanexedens]|uniref:hypothetical protein n=1 Tax=Paenibacillus xylanexedens TaxID=528191 RepID=UPI0011AB16ED|nr:hypothetical protein [Paenibacillus xylanexedens]
MVKSLVDQIQKNTIILICMFIISLLGGIITIILGWNDFYNDYLSKQLELPVWFFLFIIFVTSATMLFFKQRSNSQQLLPKGLVTIEGEFFGVQQVNLDGKRFVNCKFDGTELIYNGEEVFSLEKNEFISPPRISFRSHAGDTLAVLEALHKSPEFKSYIDETFK